MISPGDVITVRRRARAGPPPPTGRALIVTDHAILIALTGGMAYEAGENVVLLASPDGHQLAATARYAGASGQQLLFLTPQGWRPVEARDAHRYALGHTAEVRSVLGQSRQQGLIVDISIGGLAVTVPQKPGGRQVEVRLADEGFGATLPAQVVSTSPRDDGVLLHLQFGELEPPQLAFVRNLILRLESAEAEPDDAHPPFAA